MENGHRKDGSSSAWERDQAVFPNKNLPILLEGQNQMLTLFLKVQNYQGGGKGKKKVLPRY